MNEPRENLYGSGLNSNDWYALKNATLDAYHGHEFDLPEHLLKHPVGKLLLASKEDKQLYLDGVDRAMQLLVPGSDMYWLVLTKS